MNFYNLKLKFHFINFARILGLVGNNECKNNNERRNPV